ncbi:hypothetical protein FRB93_004479 [Tulasnella sp. JGI-2019a]|nr:hypothetical protein FRB93_004479 [Tulasnella sp. JGI-2019a]
MFLNTTLRVVRTPTKWGEADDTALSPTLARLPILSPDLTDINFRVSAPLLEKTLGVFAETLQLLRHLRKVRISTFKVPGPDFESLVIALSELPELQEIEISCDGDCIGIWSSRGYQPLQSLQRLELEAQGTLAGAVSLLDCMAEVSSLTDVMLGDPFGGCTIDMNRVLKSMGGHRKLQQIEINADKALSALTSQVLRQISCCSLLESLEVNVGGPIELTDVGLGSCISSLTKLRFLTLKAGTRVAPTLTINVLGIVTTSCPAIEGIQFSRLEMSAPDLQPVFQASKTLRTLHVGNSELFDPKAVALFLDKLSNVETFRVSSQPRELWSEVQKWALRLREARFNEEAQLTSEREVLS